MAAATPEEAAKLLRRKGLIPFHIEAVATREERWTSLTPRFSRDRLTLAERTRIVRDLAALLQANLPLDQALQIIAKQNGAGRSARFLLALTDTVLSGMGLAEALRARDAGFLDHELGVVGAGESSARLGQVLGELASSLEARLEYRSRVAAVLTYPALLLVMSMLTIFIIVGVLIPGLAPLLEDSGSELPGALKALAAATDFVGRHWPAIVVILLMATLGARAALRHAPVRLAVDRLTWRAPLMGTVLVRMETARIVRTLATLLGSGISLPQSLAIAKTAGRSQMTQALMERTAEGVIAGNRLSDAIPDSPLFPSHVRQLMVVAEESNRLEQTLTHIARLYETAIARDLERLMALLGPSLTIAIGVSVGGLVVTVMQAVLGINDLVAP